MDQLTETERQYNTSITKIDLNNRLSFKLSGKYLE